MAFRMTMSEYNTLLHCEERCWEMIEMLSADVRLAGVKAAIEASPETTKEYWDLEAELKLYRREAKRIQRSIQWEDGKSSLVQFLMSCRRKLGGLI